MRALSVLAVVAALCGYYVSVMSRFFMWFLPDEQTRTDKQVYRRSLYRGPVPTWTPRAGDVIGTAGVCLLLALAFFGSLEFKI